MIPDVIPDIPDNVVPRARSIKRYRGTPPGKWLACEHPERPPHPAQTTFCVTPCRGCAVTLEVVLNQLNPLTQPNLCAAVGELLGLALGEPDQ